MSFNEIDSASIDNLFPPSLTILDLSGNQAINIQRDSLRTLRYVWSYDKREKAYPASLLLLHLDIQRGKKILYIITSVVPKYALSSWMIASFF